MNDATPRQPVTFRRDDPVRLCACMGGPGSCRYCDPNHDWRKDCESKFAAAFPFTEIPQLPVAKEAS